MSTEQPLSFKEFMALERHRVTAEKTAVIMAALIARLGKPVS